MAEGKLDAQEHKENTTNKEQNDIKKAPDLAIAKKLTGIQTPEAFKQPELAINILKIGLDQQEQIQNILKSNYNIDTPIKNLDMKELYQLPDSAKANLAYLMTMIKPIGRIEKIYAGESMVKTNTKPISTPLEEKQEEYRKSQESGKNYQKIGYALEDWQNGSPIDVRLSNTIRTTMMDYRQATILQTFSQMYPKGSLVPLMPEIRHIASGTGVGTTGIGGKINGNRELFEYSNTGKLTQNTNYLQFGFDKKPLELSIVPSGADTAYKASKITISFNDKTGNFIGNFVGNYDSTGLTWEGNVDGVALDSKTNTISIPEKYRDANISVNTESGTKKDKNSPFSQYDEVDFGLGVKNGRAVNNLGETQTKALNAIKDPMGLGKYELSDEVKVGINNTVKNIVFYGAKSAKPSIDVNLVIGADQTPFTNPKEAIKNYSIFKEQKIKELGTESPTKFASFMETFSKNIHINPSFKGEQYDAQKLLMECRFLSTMSQVFENKTLVKQIEKGKFAITGTPVNAKEKFISLEPGIMTYTKA